MPEQLSYRDRAARFLKVGLAESGRTEITIDKQNRQVWLNVPFGPAHMADLQDKLAVAVDFLAGEFEQVAKDACEWQRLSDDAKTPDALAESLMKNLMAQPMQYAVKHWLTSSIRGAIK